MQEAALKGPTSPIESYSCNLHILDSVQDGQWVTCMTMEDWHHAQQMDTTLSPVITRMQVGTLGNNSQNRPILLNLSVHVRVQPPPIAER